MNRHPILLVATARRRRRLALAARAGACRATPARQSTISEASALSALPIAVSVAAPVAVLSAGAALTRRRRRGDQHRRGLGARTRLRRRAGERPPGRPRRRRRLGRRRHGRRRTALSTGWVLSAAGEAIAFIPNEIGRALLYNERITR